MGQVCESCWREWREESIRLINHLGLQPSDPAQRAQLYAAMREFLGLGETSAP
jgi:Fe-S cluster biosynthesis and repair protein YggX